MVTISIHPAYHFVLYDCPTCTTFLCQIQVSTLTTQNRCSSETRLMSRYVYTFCAELYAHEFISRCRSQNRLFPITQCIQLPCSRLGLPGLGLDSIRYTPRQILRLPHPPNLRTYLCNCCQRSCWIRKLADSRLPKLLSRARKLLSLG
jgi:hypothetical protein